MIPCGHGTQVVVLTANVPGKHGEHLVDSSCDDTVPNGHTSHAPFADPMNEHEQPCLAV